MNNSNNHFGRDSNPHSYNAGSSRGNGAPYANHHPLEYKSTIQYRKRQATSITGALISAILFFTAILISLLVISSTKKESEMNSVAPSSDVPYTTISPSESADIQTEPLDDSMIGPPAPMNAPDFETEVVENTDIHRGNLILVNADYAYVFPESQALTTLYGNKSPVYGLSTTAIALNTSLFPIFDGMIADFSAATGCKNVLVTSGYRSYEMQQTIYDNKVASAGAEIAAQYVALPGYSEHHAGLAVDMVIYLPEQGQYYFPDYEDAQWIIDHAPEYGFILRYTEEKQDITRCAPEPWHYRYVGVPHAKLITTLGLCFEEYHEYLHQFTWNGKRLLLDEEGNMSETDGYELPGTGYMIYYVPAEEESTTTQIPVPPHSLYEISGDNNAGFIVTVHLG